MERTLSSEERIRRAEKIYQRRKMQGGVRVSTNSVNSKNQPEYRLFKKLVLQIAICLLTYFIFYLIQNSNYIFSENVINKTRDFLSYDINFESMFKQIGDYYNEHIVGLFNNEEEKHSNENIEDEYNEKANNITENTTTENVVKGNEVGIGGGNEGENLLINEVSSEITKEVSADEEQAKQLTQMEIDAKDIRENYCLIIPLKGIVSSRFGPRTASGIVSANHAGIDIAANEGTIFIAAMEGSVTYVSGERKLWKPYLY